MNERHMQAGTEPSFWLSVNTYSSSFAKDQRPNAHTSIFSIILDGGTYKSFSGIRLVIVYNEHSNFHDLAIDDCLGPKRPRGLPTTECMPKQPTVPRFKTRNWLHRRRSSVSHHPRPDITIPTIPTISPSTHQLPVCTILCYLSVLLPGTAPVFELGAELSLMAPSGHLKIGFDRTYPCTEVDHSVLLYLQCSSAHIGDPTLTPRVSNCIPVQEVRVLPTTQHRPSCPQLPTNIVRKIADFAVTKTSSRWRSHLLNLALVQKSWLPLIEIFFEVIGEDSTIRIGDPAPIARALRAKPEMARFIRNFRTTDFGGTRYTYNYAKEEDRMALAFILRLATNTRVCHIARPLFRPLSHSLRCLQQVERFSLFKPHPFETDLKDDVTFDDILNAMTGWTKLRRLSAVRWGRSNIPLSVQPRHRTYHHGLEVLELKHGHLLPSELQLFVSPTTPTLSSLALHNITGLNNQDLREFLSFAAPTLTTIFITKSLFPKSSADEEYAFEAVLPSMKRVTIVEIAGELVTTAALTRKLEPPGEDEDEFRANCSIYVHHPSETFLQGLTDALKVTHWKSISMHGPTVQSWDAEYARAVASLRDIFFFVSTRPGWWVSDHT